MIKLDPEEEAEDEDKANKTPQKASMSMANTSHAPVDGNVNNHVHLNNAATAQVRINIPASDFVS